MVRAAIGFKNIIIVNHLTGLFKFNSSIASFSGVKLYCGEVSLSVE